VGGGGFFLWGLHDLIEKCGKSQSGGLNKSDGGGRSMPPDSGIKVKKRKKVFPFNNLALLNLDFRKKLLKKVKKS
jgi:hypothetical protein